MNKKEWNEGLDHLDPDLVEKYVLQKDRLRQKKRSKEIWLRFAAIAACLALIVSAIIIVPKLRDGGAGGITPPYGTTNNNDPGIITPPDNNDNIPNIFDATSHPEKFNGSNSEFLVGSSLSISGEVSFAPPDVEFVTSDFVVKAKVINNYPDLYYKLDVNSVYKPSAYRLVQMECIETIHGEGIPKYFLYLIKNYTYVDMSVYDSLLISMSQIGTENYVLKNDTQNKMESFELPIFADYQNHPELGNIIAFTDGIFDEGLWKNENWVYGYQFTKYCLDNPQYSDLLVERGNSESDVIAAIHMQIEELSQQWWLYKTPRVLTLNFTTAAAKDAIGFVSPFINGVFSQNYSHDNNKLTFKRFINGCQTEETITIDILTEEVTYSDARYTKEDMAHMENISAHLSEKASEYAEHLPIPPHTDPEGKELLCLNLYAWYVKVDGKVYGIIKTAWRYKEKDNYFLQYYDDAYVLYDISAATATDISRDDLVSIVGTRNVYMGEYGEGIEIPM